MCRIVAWFNHPTGDVEAARLQRSLDRMHNRGSNAEGVWQEPGVWLGHRRLAILDLEVELRTPLLNAWLLRDLQPLLGTFREFPKKQPLAEAPVRPLPAALINRPKTGFSIPLKRWLEEMGRVDSSGRPSNAWAREVRRAYE